MQKERKNYEAPGIKVFFLENEDVVRTSGAEEDPYEFDCFPTIE